jgi:hypothetical protein
MAAGAPGSKNTSIDAAAQHSKMTSAHGEIVNRSMSSDGRVHRGNLGTSLHCHQQHRSHHHKPRTRVHFAARRSPKRHSTTAMISVFRLITWLLVVSSSALAQIYTTTFTWVDGDTVVISQSTNALGNTVAIVTL